MRDRFFKSIYLFSLLLLLLPAIFNFIKSGKSYFFYSDYLFGNSKFSPFSGKFDFIFLFFTFSLVFSCYFYLVKNEIKISLKYIFLVIFIFFLLPPFGSTDWMLYFNVGKNLYNGFDPFVKGVSFVNLFFRGYLGEVKNFLPMTPFFPIFLAMLFFVSLKNMYIFLLLLKILSLFLLFIIYKIFSKFIDSGNLKVLLLINPFLLFEYVSNCHYDLFWIAPSIFAIYFLTKEKKIKSILFFLISDMAKYSGFTIAIVFLRKKKIKYLLFSLFLYILFFLLTVKFFHFDLYSVVRGFFIQINWNKYSLTTFLSFFIKLKLVKIVLKVVGLFITIYFLKMIWPQFKKEKWDLYFYFYLITFFLIVSVVFFSAIFYSWYMGWAYIFSIPLYYKIKYRDINVLLTFSLYLSLLIYPFEYICMRLAVDVFWVSFYVVALDLSLLYILVKHYLLNSKKIH